MDSKDTVKMMGSNIEGIRCLARAEALRKAIKMLKYEADSWERKAACIMDNTTDNGGDCR